MRWVALLLLAGACGGPKGLPKMPPPDYEESPDPWAEGGTPSAPPDAAAE